MLIVESGWECSEIPFHRWRQRRRICKCGDLSRGYAQAARPAIVSNSTGPLPGLLHRTHKRDGLRRLARSSRAQRRPRRAETLKAVQQHPPSGSAGSRLAIPLVTAGQLGGVKFFFDEDVSRPAGTPFVLPRPWRLRVGCICYSCCSARTGLMRVARFPGDTIESATTAEKSAMAIM